MLGGVADWVWTEPAKTAETIGYIVACVKLPKHHHRNIHVDFDDEDKPVRQAYKHDDRNAVKTAVFYCMEFTPDGDGNMTFQTLFAGKNEPIQLPG